MWTYAWDVTKLASKGPFSPELAVVPNSEPMGLVTNPLKNM
jgi:hypothetical protein